MFSTACKKCERFQKTLSKGSIQELRIKSNSFSRFYYHFWNICIQISIKINAVIAISWKYKIWWFLTFSFYLFHVIPEEFISIRPLDQNFWHLRWSELEIIYTFLQLTSKYKINPISPSSHTNKLIFGHNQENNNVYIFA